MTCILDYFGKDDIIMKPYPHVVVENLLPKAEYEAMIGRFPKIPRTRPKTSNVRFNSNTKLMLAGKTPKIWKEFSQSNIGPEFWKKFVTIFRDAILEVHPDIEDRYQKKLEDFVVGMQEIKRPPYEIGCASHAALNTPVCGVPNRVRGSHVDSPVELYAGLLYMRESGDDSEGGEFTIYQAKDKFSYYGKSEVKDEDCSEVSRVRYAANTLAMFINGPRSVHGVTVRERTPYYRRMAVCHGRCSKSLFKL